MNKYIGAVPCNREIRNSRSYSSIKLFDAALRGRWCRLVKYAVLRSRVAMEITTSIGEETGGQGMALGILNKELYSDRTSNLSNSFCVPPPSQPPKK